MPLPLPQYAEIKDFYCISYIGNNNEHILQLKMLRPFMESKFPGIQVYIACKDHLIYLLQEEKNILTHSELSDRRNYFGYIRQMSTDFYVHSVEEFMKESEVPCGPIPQKKSESNGKCVLLTQGIAPTKSLSASQIEKAKKYIHSKKFSIEIDVDIKDASWVVGVESEKLFLAIDQGKKCTLIKSGVGENLFKSMFPYFEILNLDE